jgi:type I restriction enzyme S subunit
VTLPKGWVETELGQVAETKLGKMLDAAKNVGEPVPYLRNVNVRWGAFDLSDLLEMRVTPEERDELSVRNGDLFLCEGGEPGRCAVWRGGKRDLVFQKAIHRVRPCDGVEPDFLARHIEHVASSGGLSHLFTGTTIKHLPQVALQRITLPLPPPAEQRRIVAKLEALTAHLARARAELDRVPVLATKLRQAVLAGARARLSAAPLARVADLATCTFDGPFGSHLKSADYASEGVRVIRLENIGHLRFIADRQTYVPQEKYAGLARHTLQPGDILFSSFVDQQVRVCRLPEDAGLAINKADCFAIRIAEDAGDARFVTYMLAGVETFEAMKANVHGATRPRIGLSQLRDYRLPVPDLAEQSRLADLLDAAFARADRLEAEAARARTLLDRLESAILAKAFRGELVPQDPNDEPASVLLDRIRAQRAAAPKTKRGRRAKAEA